MPFIVGDWEKQMAKMGYCVAVNWLDKWMHQDGCGGEVRLTRMLDANAELSPAQFVCMKCNNAMETYPAKGGGVQPRLKGFSAKMDAGAGDDGRWR